MSAALLLVFLVLAAIGVPSAAALGIAEGVALLAFSHLPLNIIAQLIFSGLDSFILVIVPFFMLIGILTRDGGFTTCVFRFAESWLGWMPGGRGQAAVFTFVILGGVCSPAMADLSAAGYPMECAASMALRSSVPAALMPSSILLVMAGAAAHESVGRLLISGIAPGLLIALLFMLCHPFCCREHNAAPPMPFDFRAAIARTAAAVPALLGPVMLPGAILFGFPTPTEAAAFAAAYTLLVAVLVYRKLSWRQIPGIFAESARLAGSVLAIAVTARAAGWILQYDGLPDRMIRLLGSVSHGPVIITILTGIFALLAGSWMEPTAVIFILLPILLPAVNGLGIDPIHFLLFFIATLALGLAIKGITRPPKLRSHFML